MQCPNSDKNTIAPNSTYTHPFNGPLSRTTRVSWYQKGKTNLDFTEARDSEWQWHQLDHMQICTSLQTDNHTGTPPLSFFTGRILQALNSKHGLKISDTDLGFVTSSSVNIKTHFLTMLLANEVQDPPLTQPQNTEASLHKP